MIGETVAPHVGPPTDGEGCTYGALDEPVCGAPPVVHLRVESEWGTGGLPTCARHQSIARVSGLVTGEHPYGAECSGDNYMMHWSGAV